jgi:hypothetical protein
MDTIRVPTNSTQTLTAVNNSTYGPTGLPPIRSAITLDGNGSTIRRPATAPDFRILAVSSSGNLTLQETTITGGVSPSGRGVHIAGDGYLDLNASTISNNVGSGVSASLGRRTAMEMGVWLAIVAHLSMRQLP